MDKKNCCMFNATFHDSDTLNAAFQDNDTMNADFGEVQEVTTTLMSDGAKNLSITGRHFGIMAGAGITCKSASAGATEYRVSNSRMAVMELVQ